AGCNWPAGLRPGRRRRRKVPASAPPRPPAMVGSLAYSLKFLLVFVLADGTDRMACELGRIPRFNPVSGSGGGRLGSGAPGRPAAQQLPHTARTAIGIEGDAEQDDHADDQR